ncbi:carboxypeptidase [Olivibacter sp. SDN3]|uniref:S10 family peptidase n=1 Tax=Olivibacter sp. SDN3 TaxID=2764720 RepID=UPI00165184D9|nr:carboxypeptidase [Olivibacter sp. SDN3]QNL50350.1 carboxypeptidase [Olivibacter sp. SDN3]
MRGFYLTIIASIMLFQSGLAQQYLPIDTVVSTKHSATINGQRVNYEAKTGMQPSWNEEGEAVAAINYTYYERTDIQDKASRPLVISFNGGPGSASLWMEIGYTGPRMLTLDDEGYPVQPYGEMRDNPYSILDVADIVYVNPVNTGYSRILEKDTDKKLFFGVNADIKYLAAWLNTFVTRINRWQSPKYLIGESYGTTRVSGLALELQNAQWMYLNGVVLVSPTDLGLKREGPVEAALRLPYFAAAAWFHQALSTDLQQKDLDDLLPEVESFTLNEFLPAITKGGSLSKTEREQIAEQVARYAGLEKKVVLQQNFDISTWFFWKELLRDRGLTIGRLDSRYLGVDKKDGGERPDFNAELTSWSHSFTPAINHYLRNELNFATDVKYNVFGSVYPWDRSDDHTGENLQQAMAQNPYLHVLTQSGYYDGACDYFNAKYNMWQMDPGGKFQDRMSFKGYRTGHMIYMRQPDLKEANEDLRLFIKNTLIKKGEPAKY